MNTYWRILGFAKPIEKYAVPYFFYIMVHAIFNTFNFVLIIPILNTLFDSSAAKVIVDKMPEFKLNTAYFQDIINYGLYCIYGAQYSVMDVLVLLAVIIIFSVFMSNIFKYFAQRTIENMRIKTLERIRNRVYDYVMGLHVGFFSNERKGDIISRITSDVQVVRFCITNTLQVLFREPFLIFGYLFALIKISWELTIFTSLFLPITAFIIGRLVKNLRSKAKNAQTSFGEMSSVLDETLAGVKIIKSYNATDYILSKFHAINKKYSTISRKISRRQQLASPMSEFLGVSSVAVILIFGGNLVIEGSLNAADFMAYIAIFSQITRPVRTLADSFTTINQGIAAGERVLGLLDTENEIKDKANAIDIKEFKHSIEFKDVRMSYDKVKDIIKGVNFTIKKGQTIALVGASGGGKSTISDLIPRFYDVSSGEILIDGINIKDYKKGSLRMLMGMVAQDTFMFNDTIENNIRFGNLTATEEDVINAAKIANAHEFILSKDAGYQEVIGDRGMKLSGGQRQRISIARAVLKNPEILILDEATSALDTESEVMVQKALDNLLTGRTSIIIAHRLSTIRNADYILVIEDGQITEQGDHKQLIEKEGVYAKLIEMQQLA